MIKPYFGTPESEFAEAEIIFRRGKKLWDEVQNSFPDHLGNFTLSVSSIGTLVTRAFIYSPHDVSEKDTRDAMNWLKTFNHKIERNFRADEGTFGWISKMEREDESGKYEILILLERANPLNCKIKKVKKTVEVYESVCK